MPSDKSTGETGYLRYSGYFDWPEFYSLMTNWANENLFKIFEPLYKDKTSGEGFTERELKWQLEKKADRFNKYIIVIELKMWDCQEVEVTQNDETKKMQRGRLRATINTEVERDYQGKFQDTQLFQNFWEVYTRMTKWDWGFSHWDYLYNKKYDLQEAMKKQLGIDTQ